jgi:hypothetical protein
MSKSKKYVEDPSALKLYPNPAQARFLFQCLGNFADFQNRDGLGYQTGFRATFNGGRGCGKTNVLMRLVAESAFELPRAKMGLASMTFRHVQDVVLSQSRKVFAEYGLHEYDSKTRPWGHYVLNRRPPEGWWHPWEGVNTYDNCVSFKNGYTVVFLSADRPDTARGLNLDQLLMDESFKLKESFYNTVLRKTVRANKYLYKDPRPGRKGHNHPLHWLIADFTSAAWTPEQQWIYKTEELMKKNPKKYFFMESTPYDNLMNLPGDWIESEREASDSELTFEIEVLNRRVEKLENAYYPALSFSKHVYSDFYEYEFDKENRLYKDKRKDYDPWKPIESSLDFNARFTCQVIAQDHGKELRFIDNLFVKRADTTLVEELAHKFCEKYKHHLKKVLYLYGDNSGKKGDPGRNKTHYQLYKKVLMDNGWRVVDCVQNSYPPYKIRYRVVNTVLSEKFSHVPRIRINEQDCKSLLISLKHTPLIGDNFEKDKRSEDNINLDQQYATHLSDAFDYIIFKKYSRIVPISATGAGMRFGKSA